MRGDCEAAPVARSFVLRDEISVRVEKRAIDIPVAVTIDGDDETVARSGDGDDLGVTRACEPTAGVPVCFLF